jgi:2-amino-4-hydroxy-6-hydroxymethyldihydropteridine diphosphokinase
MSQSSSSGKHDVIPAERAILSLGSNIGERERNVLRAAWRLAGSGGIISARLSSLYETEPVGNGFTRCFVNAAMSVMTTLDPHSLLKLCMSLEMEEGRGPVERSGDRILDIDVIMFGEARIDSPELKLPHPRMRERRFVLQPLAELEPLMKLPPDGVTAGQAVLAVPGGRVIRISSRGRKVAKSSENR